MAFEVAYAAGAIVVGVVFVVSRTIFGSRNSSNDNRTRARSMSFGSSALRNGAFPAKTNVWPPIVNTIFYYKTCPSVDDLVYCCRSLLEYDRFRSIAIKEKGNWVFKDIGDSIDIKRDLIETYTVKNVAERMAKIDEIVADNLENQPMKPLWKIIRIISEDDSNDVILSRVHHVYGDGMSLVIAMTKMFTDGNGQPFSVGAAQKVREKRNKDKSKEQVQAKPSMFTTEKIWRALKATFEVLMLPNTSYDSNTKFTVPDQRKMVMSNRRKTVLFPTVQLDFVKEIKNKAGVTVNDVLFTATAGAIARYCKWKKDPVIDSPKLFSRALMPVAFPRKKEEIESTSNALR